MSNVQFYSYFLYFSNVPSSSCFFFFLNKSKKKTIMWKQRQMITYHASAVYLEDDGPVYAEALDTTRVLGSWYKDKSSCSLLWATSGSSTSKPGPWTSFGIIMPKEQTQAVVNTGCYFSFFIPSRNSYGHLLGAEISSQNSHLY